MHFQWEKVSDSLGKKKSKMLKKKRRSCIQPEITLLLGMKSTEWERPKEFSNKLSNKCITSLSLSSSTDRPAAGKPTSPVPAVHNSKSFTPNTTVKSDTKVAQNSESTSAHCFHKREKTGLLSSLLMRLTNRSITILISWRNLRAITRAS